MEPNQEKAWSFLTETEKNSLFLQMSQGQSSWEAGEILGISHYKYLELRERSIKFFKMFAEYFENTETLIPVNCLIEERFRDYLEACIEHRLTKKASIKYAGDSSMVVPEISRKIILRNMDRLKASQQPSDIRLYKLIMEFDRWNNQRILPRSIQQPSAYKRRNNKREKIYIKYLLKLPTYKIESIWDIFEYKPRKQKAYYITLISYDLFNDEGYKVIKVKREPEVIEKLSKLYIYIFESEELADVFGYMTTRYLEKTKGPKLGQQFWAGYREHIKRALNYNQVNNVDFYSEKLDMAYDIPHKRKKLDKPLKGAKRIEPEIIYKE